MKKTLAYKTKKDEIYISYAADKDAVQRFLSYVGREKYIQMTEASKLYEEREGMDPENVARLERRIAWANSVADFDNISDEELQNHVLCDALSDKVYYHWIDSSKIKKDDFFRDSWKDITAEGAVDYDLDKAKTFLREIFSKTIIKDKVKREKLLDAGDVEADPEVQEVDQKISTLTNGVFDLKSKTITNIKDLDPYVAMLEN